MKRIVFHLKNSASIIFDSVYSRTNKNVIKMDYDSLIEFVIWNAPTFITIVDGEGRKHTFHTNEIEDIEEYEV